MDDPVTCKICVDHNEELHILWLLDKFFFGFVFIVFGALTVK